MTPPSPRAKPPLDSHTGATFTTLVLEHRHGEWAFRPTRLALGFTGIVLVSGSALVLWGLGHLDSSVFGGLVFASVGAVFVWIGAYLRAFLAAGARIDLLRRQVRLQRAVVSAWPWHPVASRTIAFDQILAVDLRHKTVFVEDTRRRNIAVDLLTRDGDRIPLIAHSDEPQGEADARQLSALLGVELKDRRAGPSMPPGPGMSH